MKDYLIIEHEEAKSLLTNALAIEAIEACFKEKANNTFFAHAKYNIEGTNGNLCITPGESAALQKVIGFRLYDVIRDDFSNQEQLVVVYDNETGRMKGIVISHLVGAYRTAAINAVMHNYFKKEKVEVLGLVGAGFQARIHLSMFCDLLKPKVVKIFNRTRSNAEVFVQEMKAKLDKRIKFEIINEIGELKDVDSLLMTSRSTDCLLSKGMFDNGTTITTVGPKLRGRSEVSEDFAKTCDFIFTDSIEQVNKYGDNFFIEDLNIIHDFSSVYNNNDLIRKSEKEVILLCSVGMGGTEVVLANALISEKLAKL